MAGSKRKIIRVLLFDPDATDSDSGSDSESQIKNKKTVIQTIELRKSAPTRKPKTLIYLNPKPQMQSSNSPLKPSKTPIQTTNPPNSTSSKNQNPNKTLKEDSNSVKKQPSSQYKGVRRRQSGNWAAEIRDPIRGTRVWLGTFKSEQLAHQVYQAALMHFEREKTQMKESKNRGNPTGPVQSVEDLDMKEGEIKTGDLHSVQSVQGLQSALMKKSKEMKETRTTGPVQCFDDLPSFVKRDGTGDVQCVLSDQGLPSALMKKKGNETEILQMKEADVSVQCFQSVKPKSSYTRKKRTETLIGPPVQSPPFIPKTKKDSTCKTGNEIPVKSNSSITSLSSSSSREKSNSCILDSGVSQQQKGGEADFDLRGLEIPDFDFQFDEAELLGDFRGEEEDLIRLDDVPLWTENFDSCDLSFLDL